MFKNKKLLITGGTGSFGNAVASKLLKSNLSEIHILSRDEKKQDDMRKKFNNEKLKFHLGDVRDYQSIIGAIRNVDYIFHAAALKQVPSCEFHPLEATKTNVLGTENVLEAAIVSNIKKVICLSTDKAVHPINAMGISKALMEKVAISKSRSSKSTIICCTRYGNVMASRGSVIPLFLEQIKNHKKITITDPKMTRFMMSLNDAVDLVIYAFQKGSSGEIFVQKSPAVSIEILVEAIKQIMNVPKHEIKIIGTRHGEKLFEVLLSREEKALAKDLGSYYSISPDLRSLNYENFFEKGQVKVNKSDEYNSHNTKQLNINGMKSLLLKLDEFKI